MARTALLNIMVQAALKAGRSLIRDFGEVENLQVSRKGPADFVSNADRRAEKIVFDELMKARPTYSFLMEEGGSVAGTDGQHRWIVDPLDGTTNFLHGIPYFAVSIGLERNGEIVAGVIYNPATDELFTAERGGGAYVNDRRLRVGGRRHLADCVVVTGIQSAGRPEDALALRRAAHIIPAISGLRRFGAASVDLAWVAAGRFDAMFENALHPWDMAAGILMIREAGGFVTDFSGGNGMFANGGIVAGNEIVHRDLLKALAEIR
ncbi:MAG TPA: inositol monophosphatase family protein [Devosiaceae bacterium]